MLEYAVNFHASLLPAYRGKHPVFWALRHDESWAGLTVHFMSAKIDAGAILYRVRVRTRLEDPVASLYLRIMDESYSLPCRLVRDAAQGGALRPRPQNEAEASYFSSVKEEDFLLDFRRPARLLRRWIAITPGKCYLLIHGERVFVYRAAVKGDAAQHPSAAAPITPGTLLRIGRSSCSVATAERSLVIRTVLRMSREGEPPMSMAEFCKRAGLAAGGPKGRIRRRPLRKLETRVFAGGGARCEPRAIPLILGFSGFYLPRPDRPVHNRLSYYAVLELEVCRNIGVPSCLLFNESAHMQWVLEALEMSFHLVMFTDEHLSLREQTAAVKSLAEKAHAKGAAAEGELSPLSSAGGEAMEVLDGSRGGGVEKEVAFVREKGVDAWR